MRLLNSILCRHDFYWSERHHSDRCRRCGLVRAAQDSGPAMVGGLAALLAADDDDLEIPPSAPVGLIKDWDRADDAGAPEPGAVGLHGSQLLNRLDDLIAGGELSRAQTIETLLAVIEDGQSSDPVLFGPSAATWYARLHRAR